METGKSRLLVNLAALPTEMMPIDALMPGDSPRLAGESEEHIETLAQSEREFPPIVIHRRSMRVIDGMHRLRAARLRGEEKIEVSFFDGNENAAFVLAVECNTAHGLPLSLADRIAAAQRIVTTHPEWSDRAVAASTGLAAATVKGIRQRSTDDDPQLNARLGLDGKMRPINSAEGRRRAGQIIAERPEASLREVAREAGISPATVRDVRERLDRGQEPVPPRQQGRRAGDGDLPARRRGSRYIPLHNPAVIVDKLRKDPSLRFNETRRVLLRWLILQLAGAEKWREFLERVPPHSYVQVAALARSCAHIWNSFAEELEQRSASV